MLNSSTAGDSGNVSGRRSAFSRTCALLGQFVREKKGFADLSNEIGGGSNNAFHHTTMNLFPVDEKAEEVPTSKNSEFASLFPQHVGSTAPMPNLSEIESAPMTIFYAGQVVVFNDFPAYKAKEIMELASLGTAQNPKITAPFVALDENNNDSISENPMTKSVLDSMTLITPRLNVTPTSVSNSHQMLKPAQKPIRTICNNLPVVRKTSLQRFLGKRKDRIAAQAPYSMSKPEDVQSKPKPNESNSWLGLAAAPAGARLP